MKRILSGTAGLALLVLTIAFVASAAQADTITQPVGTAGSVTFSTDGGVLALISADPADGWDYTVDRAEDDHLKVTFFDATGAEAEFEAELDDDGLELESSDESGSTTSLGDTTSTTIDDEDDDEADDDNSGPNADDDSDDDADDDDDNSGPNADDDSDDDSDDDDDNSGRGSDDDSDDDDSTTTTVVTIP